jgi:hypothetical protein
MTQIVWDNVGERLYETGVDRGVLYVPNNGIYDTGYGWNGLTTVTEKPTGAEATAQYADNIKYLNLISAEDFEGTIEAFTYPTQFNQFDGVASPQVGVNVGQQTRKTFGLSYRTKLGNDVLAGDYGYKLHLVYGCTAAPSEKAYATVNDSPEAMGFSWDFSTVPVPVSGLKPTAIITIDSTKVSPANLTALENILYGVSANPRLPLPDEVIALFAGALTTITPTTPTATTAGVITIPVQTGTTYRRDDTNAVVTGTVTLTTIGDTLLIKAYPTAGYVFKAQTDNDWSFTKTV